MPRRPGNGIASSPSARNQTAPDLKEHHRLPCPSRLSWPSFRHAPCARRGLIHILVVSPPQSTLRDAVRPGARGKPQARRGLSRDSGTPPPGARAMPRFERGVPRCSKEPWHLGTPHGLDHGSEDRVSRPILSTPTLPEIETRRHSTAGRLAYARARPIA